MHVVSAPVLESWAALPDEQVVRHVLAGQTALFEVLMRRHNERLYRAARAILRDEAEAEDVMQQAYVNAYTHLRQFDGRAAFSTWLTRIAVHEALARARRRGRYIDMDPENPSTIAFPTPSAQGPDPERLAFARELGALMESAIDELPDGTREVFMLRQVEGMSTREVAEALDVSQEVVKTRLSRARAALRRDLYDRAGIAASDAFRFVRPRCDRVVAAVLARIGS
ncbi:MAG TPA: RNA polymerase sigma factor [Vicinamibacterales bacterium]|nr:RNA polymerase sigma factor [Vicinamibacterales bacterium]